MQNRFGDKGTLLQPTPQNQPNSKVYKRQLTCEDISEAIGYEDNITVTLKRKQRFGKSFGWGQSSLRLERAMVTFSSTGKKLTIAGDFMVDFDDDYY